MFTLNNWSTDIEGMTRYMYTGGYYEPTNLDYDTIPFDENNQRDILDKYANRMHVIAGDDVIPGEAWTPTAGTIDPRVTVDYVDNTSGATLVYNPDTQFFDVYLSTEAEMPETVQLEYNIDEGTSFGFNQYNSVDSEDVVASGTVSYSGLYNGTPETDLPSDGTYVYGTATMTSDSSQFPVFILRTDTNKVLKGERIPAWSIDPTNQTQTGAVGYIEFTSGL